MQSNTNEHTKLDFHPELLAAREAVQDFAVLSGDVRNYEDPIHVSGMLRYYCPEASVHVERAAILHDLGSRVLRPTDPDHRAAFEPLVSAIEILPARERRYTTGLLADCHELDVRSREYRYRIEHTDEMYIDAVQNGFSGTLPSDFWMHDGPVVSSAEMRALIDDVNIESFLINANKMLKKIASPPQREAQLLQNILEVEYVYAPTLEVLGYAGLATAIRNAGTIARLDRAGHGDLIERARDMLYGSTDESYIDRTLSIVLGDGYQGVDYGDRSLATEEMYTGMGYASAYMKEFDENAQIQVRQKSLGSLVLKLLDASYVANHAQPFNGIQDILGVNIVTPDWKSASETLANVVNRLMTHKSTKLVKTPHRQSAIRAQAPEMAIGNLSLALTRVTSQVCIIEDVATKPEEFSCFRVTGTFSEDNKLLPFEVQVTPEEAQKVNTYGSAAHYATKTRVQCQLDSKSLEVVAKRRARMTRHGTGLLSRSIPRAENLLSLLYLPWED